MLGFWVSLIVLHSTLFALYLVQAPRQASLQLSDSKMDC
jgi:hypothetical protein